MATLKIGNAHNESGQKFFASNDLTTNSTDLLWKGARVLTEASFTVSGDFEGTGSADSPLSWKGFKAENAEGTVLSETVKTIKAGTNVTLSAQDGVLTIESEGGTGGSVDLSDYTGEVLLKNEPENVGYDAAFSIGSNGVIKLSATGLITIGGQTAGNVSGSPSEVNITGQSLTINTQEGIRYNDAFLNEPGGLVKLGSDGKIPSNLYEAGGSGTEIDWSNVNATEIKLNGSDGIWLNTIMNDIFLRPQNSAGTLFIDAIDIQFNEVGLNQPTGLVQLGADGKIPVELYDTGSGGGGDIDLSDYSTTSNISLKTTGSSTGITLGSTNGTVSIYSGYDGNGLSIGSTSCSYSGGNVSLSGRLSTSVGSYGAGTTTINATSLTNLKLRIGSSGTASSANTAGGFVVLGSDGKIPTSLYEQAAGGLTSVDTGNAINTGLTGDGTASSPISLDLSNYGTRDAISLTTFGGFKFKISATTAMSIGTDANVRIATHTYLAGNSEADVYFHGNATNTANGLVVLGADGKIPTELYDAGTGGGTEIDWANVSAEMIGFSADMEMSLYSPTRVTIGGGELLINTSQLNLGEAGGTTINFNLTTLDDLQIYHVNEGTSATPNTAGGFAIVGSDGKLPSSIIPESTVDLSNYTGELNITATSNASIRGGTSGNYDITIGDSGHGVIVHAAQNDPTVSITSFGSGGNIDLNSANINVGGSSGSTKITLKSSNVSVEPSSGPGTFSVNVMSYGSVKFTAGNIYFNNNASNTAGGFAIVGLDGKLPASILPESSGGSGGDTTELDNRVTALESTVGTLDAAVDEILADYGEGSGALVYRVVASATEPENPTEGMIWIQTE